MMDATTHSLHFTDNTTDNFLPTDDTNQDASQTIIQVVKILTILSDSITFILGTVGNGLVIWNAGFKMSKTVNIIWFLNLAVADFVFSIFFPFQITEEVMDGHWPFNWVMCKIVLMTLSLNTSVNTAFLVIISVDNCISILCPVWSRNYRTLKLASLVSTIIWIVCFIFSTPDLVFSNIDYDPDSGIYYCISIYADDPYEYEFRNKAMLITRFIYMWLIPFFITLVCYSLIIHRLRKSKSFFGFSRPFKITVTVEVCFFCMWLPFHLWPFLEYMNIEFSVNTDSILSHIVCSIGFIDSCVNPIVYAFVGRDFKESLLKSLPFLLESTFQENYETENHHVQTTVETVIK